MGNELVPSEVIDGEIVDDRVFAYYDSNNSGGSWWLDDDDWFALEAAGWEIEWVAAPDEGDWMTKRGYDLPRPDTSDPNHFRWLGGIATEARREMMPGDTLDSLIREWEELTGQNYSDEGCGCCGSPHYFFKGGVNKYS